MTDTASLAMTLTPDDLADWRSDYHAGCLAIALARRGVESRRIRLARREGRPEQEWLYVEIGERRYIYRWGVLCRWASDRWVHVNGEAVAITAHKQRSKRALKALGIPVPEGRSFKADEVEEALAYFRKRGWRACIKPSDATNGKGVFVGIEDEAAFRACFSAATAFSKTVLVERHVIGEQVRLVYVEPKVVAARLDTPANVTGDGRHTIAELVDAKNAERARRRLPSHVPLLLDGEVDRILGLSGLTLASVPEPGRRVLLRGTSNLPTGGDALSCLHLVHPTYVAMFEGLARDLKLKISAVDMMVEDYRAPIRDDGYHILEVNSSPGIGAAFFPWEGPPVDAAGPVADNLISGRW